MRVRARVCAGAGAGGCECYLYSEALCPEHEVGYRAGIEHIEHIPHLQGRVDQEHADRAARRIPASLQVDREEKRGGRRVGGGRWSGKRPRAPDVITK